MQYCVSVRGTWLRFRMDFEFSFLRLVAILLQALQEIKYDYYILLLLTTTISHKKIVDALLGLNPEA